ncbi:MAG: helix-turn-helix domain-containing protein, partial [Paracoccaceae bacterium]
MINYVVVARGDDDLPEWVPAAARHYIEHTESGHSIRKLARGAGCHASTVLRQVRKTEARRDDLLVDEALSNLGEIRRSNNTTMQHQAIDTLPMIPQIHKPASTPDDATVEREARRILRRLCEPAACLAVARDMEKAVVVREAEDGRTTRTALVERPV